jgi:SpoIID/LytB domain protein
MLNGKYYDGKAVFTGEQNVQIADNKILWQGNVVDTLELKPTSSSCSFTLHSVTIGIGFHWERNEEQNFTGNLSFKCDNGTIWAINGISVEEYLESVISSEMKPTAPAEFLKAHAVISRSWVIAQCHTARYTKQETDTKADNCYTDSNKIIKWYDHEQHTLFDVCADDHCQRYQGKSRITNSAARKAIQETYGEILTHNGFLCDARFSKCCGGITEEFESCWQEEHHPYLTILRDNRNSSESLPDLRNEDNAKEWILERPKSFCGNADGKILKDSLNGYDLETPDFYRWKVEYTAKELTELFHKKTGLDLGTIIDLKPLKRGGSGRIIELEVTGTNSSIVIGKELEIRRVLSHAHLYSSAFVVSKKYDEMGNISKFILNGAGWGHGVGLCQIGAAVMGEKGYSYKDILLHYYPETALKNCY